MICPKCKKEFLEEANLCPYCGIRISQQYSELGGILNVDKRNTIDDMKTNSLKIQLSKSEEVKNEDSINAKSMRVKGNIKAWTVIIFIIGLLIIHFTNSSRVLISGKWTGINSDGAPVVLEMNNGEYRLSLDNGKLNNATVSGTYSISTNIYKDAEYNTNFYILNLLDKSNSNATKVRVGFNDRNTMIWATTQGSKDLIFNRISKKLSKSEQYIFLFVSCLVIYKVLIKKLTNRKINT